MKKILNSHGQSTIEFIFSMSFALFLVIYTIKVALNYTTGYLAHYANFVASRTYLVIEPDGNEQVVNTAPAVGAAAFGLDKLSGSPIFPGDEAIRIQAQSGEGILKGTTFSWSKRFGLSGMFGGDLTLEMTSESYLGREPDRLNCLRRTCFAASGGGSSCREAYTLADNGC